MRAACLDNTSYNSRLLRHEWHRMPIRKGLAKWVVWDHLDSVESQHLRVVLQHPVDLVPEELVSMVELVLLLSLQLVALLMVLLQAVGLFLELHLQLEEDHLHLD